jgi:hypothetical protein
LGSNHRSAAFISLILVLTLTAHSQQGSAVMPTESKFRAVRTITGSKGEDQAGRFVILDPRTIFYIPADKKVIAYFEWDGPVGTHHFEGIWKNPEGKISIVSDFRYEAKQRRFAGLWELLLSETMQPGLWTIEARIDGESSGSHTVQILAASKPDVAEVSRKFLSLSELYKRATAATVRIENLGSKGTVQRDGLGFFVDDGTVLTAFRVIDGASRIRITPASGVAIETDQVVAVQRWEDWAVLKPHMPEAQQTLSRAPPGSWSVGEHCSTLNLNPAGALIIVGAQITGVQKVPNAGERISVNSELDQKAVGSPVFNEFGEVVGIMAGVPFPGAFSPLDWTLASSQMRFSPYPSAAVPISQIKTDGTPMPLSQWEAKGQFMPALVPVVPVMRGAIAKKVAQKNSYPDPQDERFLYKRSDGQLTALVVWRPEKKLKTLGAFYLYSSGNRLLMQSKVSKFNFDPRDPLTSSTWPIPIGALANDIYRVDLRFGDETVWRAFFRVAD